MTEQEKVSAKNKRGRPATGRGLNIGVRMHNDLLGAVDRWITEEAAAGNVMTRSEAVRRLTQEALEHMGLLDIRRED